MADVFRILIQLLLILLLAPLTGGIIKKVKALTQKRRGAPVLQLYRDLWKLLKKSVVISDNASWIFRAAPYAVLTTSIAAALLVPAVGGLAPRTFNGDLILFFYLLALGRFFLILAGMDTASTFGGMGSSREALIGALAEPAVLVTVFTLGLQSGSTSSVAVMQAAAATGLPLLQPVYLLTSLALLIVILAETSRIPVDDPATHLELTMVHEAMILEHSGRHLALMEYGAAVKELTLITLLVNVSLPHEQLPAVLAAGAAGLLLSIAIYVVKVLLATLVIAAIEAGTVKFRFFSVPNLAAMAFILAFLGFLQSFVLGR